MVARIVIFLLLALPGLAQFGGGGFTPAPGGGSSGASPAGPTNASQFNGGGGIFAGSANIVQDPNTRDFILTPGSDLTVTVVPTMGGATECQYYVIAHFADGSTTGSSLETDIMTCPATLDATHYATIGWTAPLGSTTCDVFTDIRGMPSSLGKLSTLACSAQTFRDDGVAADGVILYPSNTTGSLKAGALFPFIMDSFSSKVGNTPNISTAFTLDSDIRYDGVLRPSVTLVVNNTTGTFGAVVNSQFNANGFAVQSAGQANYFLTSLQDLSGGAGATFTSVYNQVDVQGNAPGTVWANYEQTKVYNGGALGTGYGYFVDSPYTDHFGTPGSITTFVDFYGADLSNPFSPPDVTNKYYSWDDSRGVLRTREDSTYNGTGQAITCLYNNGFAKYTPGAVNFERGCVGAWDASNIFHIYTQAGGTGTLREFEIDAQDLRIPILAFAALGAPTSAAIAYCSNCTVTSGSDNTCAGSGTGANAVRVNGVWKCWQ